jgi:uncharacterized membrane protein
LFALASLPFGGLEALARFSGSGWFWMALAGIVHFVIGRYGNYRSIRALGANLSSPLQQLSVPISIILAILYLGESLTPLRVAGFVLVMFGPAIMLRQRKGPAPQKTTSGFQPSYSEGFFWGLVSAFGYGASPLFIMKGLGPEGGLVDSIAGGFISYSVATIVILMMVMHMGGSRVISSLDRTAGKWFLISAVFVFLSQLFRYMALAVAPVTVVVPIQRLSPVFRVIFSWILNRDHEFFGFWVILGIGLSIVGAVMLAISTDLVASLLPLSWQPFLNSHWP